MILFAATGDSIVRIDRDAGTAGVALARSGAQCVALHPLRRDVVYAGSRGQGLWRSADAGRTWEDCHLPAPDVFSVAISAADGSVYAGCEPSMLFASRDEGRTWRELESLRAIPSAPTWSFPPRPWTSHVRWIAPSPHHPSLLLAGIELGGVMRSEDGGETWADHRPGAKLDAHALAWHPEARGRAYEAAGDGSAWSFDGGDTWAATDEGRDRNYVWALAVDPGDPDTWYVSAAPGPFHAHADRPADAAIYRWQGGGPWRALVEGSAAMPYALAAVNGDLIAAYRSGRIDVSSDRGATWQQLELSGDRLMKILAIAVQ
jgi:hypothetical protein